MSDKINHECGIALIRLKKPLEYYIDKYNSPTWALNKLYLLMEKQHNRGQDGAGIAAVKLNPKPGERFIHRIRSIDVHPIKTIFKEAYDSFESYKTQYDFDYSETELLKSKIPFAAEVLLGHLRYGTHGKNSIDACHPFHRMNNWKSRNLVMAGNFNMTNALELFEQLVALGQNPIEKGDTITVLEKIGHFLDDEVQRQFAIHKEQCDDNAILSVLIENNLDVQRILSRAAKDFDGGYAMAGIIGNGDAFVLRDPNGIRPAYYHENDELVVVASERPCIQTVFKLTSDEVKEVTPGHALIIQGGTVSLQQVLPSREIKSCSFERIYFSRGTDSEIYHERKELGRLLAPEILHAIDKDIQNTVFSFVPNTAEVAFYGLLKGMEEQMNDLKKEAFYNPDISKDELWNLLSQRPRVEKIAVKDAKLRTFITEDLYREELVAHVYDVTYGSVIAEKDTLVIMDDSIVRGTTLQKSILTIIGSLNPKKVIIVSSAPQIRYPDCYGIDMSKLKDFVAFRAALSLIKKKNLNDLLENVYTKCQDALKHKSAVNFTQELYAPFTYQEVSDEIGKIVTPIGYLPEVKVIYQTIENLHLACPKHLGDWYFTGNYPTPGGALVANRAFINFMEGKDERAY